MKQSLLTLTCLSLLLSATAFGDEHATSNNTPVANPNASNSQQMAQVDPAASSQIHDLFIKLDKNKDGYIEKNEASNMQGLEKDFSKISKNGKLDENSFIAWKLKQHPTSAQKKIN